MKKFVIIVLLLWTTLMYGSSHDFGKGKEQLMTPTLWLFAPEMFACNLTNIDEKTHQVQIRIVSNGKVLLESKVLSLQPKHTTNHKIEGPKKGGPLYCEFTVEGNKKMYRGVAVLFHSPKGNDSVALSAE